MHGLRFFHPEPRRQRLRIIPVFLPYLGCPHRCLYCAQHLQTGTSPPCADTPPPNTNILALEAIHARMTRDLKRLTKRGASNHGLAFYGGTFTALPRAWQERLLNTVQPHRVAGTIAHVRCSTRPDRIALPHLQWLRDKGLDMVELGVQSFDPVVLGQSQRGYTPDTAINACRAVRESGLELGIQLMPGLPGACNAGWFRDIDQTCALAPEVVRIYPCLVLRGTGLGQAYLSGTYCPWSLARTVWAVSRALSALWRRSIPVIRIGLAPEGTLTPAVLAGPWHPALGHMAKSHALRDWITRNLACLPDGPLQARIPQRFAAEFWGHGREHARTWQRRGLSRTDVCSWNRPYFLIAPQGHSRNLKQHLDSTQASL